MAALSAGDDDDDDTALDSFPSSVMIGRLLKVDRRKEADDGTAEKSADERSIREQVEGVALRPSVTTRLEVRTIMLFRTK